MAYRILIADDDLHTRRILETLLTREPGLAGPEIVTATDGQEALTAVDGGRFDLVITDLLMPRMDGFAFARALRKHDHGKSVPLLVTSAIYKDRVSLGKLEQETNCEFYAKPYQLRDLIRAVTKHLAAPQQPVRQRVASKPQQPAWPTVQDGKLADRPLPRLLIEYLDAGATGVLGLTRAKLKKEVFIYLGHPIGAESNLRNETLGQMLAARGALDPAKLQEALELTRTGGDRLGAVLVEKGWMKEAEVLKYLAAQVRLKIVTALRWPDGEYRFIPGDSFSGRMTHLSVDAPRVVFSGLKKSAHIEEIARAASAVRGRLVIDPRFDKHRDSFVRVFGDQALANLQDRPRPADLAARNDGDLLVAYDALRMTGLGTLEAEEAPPPRKPSAPISQTSRVAQRSEALYRQLFGDDDSTSSLPEPPPAVTAASDDPGVVSLPPASAISPAGESAAFRPRTTDPGVRLLHEALLREYLTVHSRDHYQILRISRGASTAQVQAAFEQRRDEFRLERFSGIDLGRDHDRLETLHQAFQEARDVLLDQRRRAAYDRALDAPTPDSIQPTAGPALAAEAQFRDALRLLGSDEPREAVARLREAVSLQPDQADYHAMLGWAIFSARELEGNPAQATNEARAELASALAIDPDHVAAHEFLGRMLFAGNDDVTAADHLERALHLEPGRPEAIAALEAVYLRTKQVSKLERLYRSQIARLGEPRSAPLWWELALLLRDHRCDRIGALAALETYVKLVPDDARAREALAKLERRNEPTPSPDRGADAASLRAQWHAAPDDPAPLRALYRLHEKARKTDAALQVACVLHVRGAGDAETEEFARSHRPRFLQRAIAPVSWGQVDSLRHADDDRDLVALFTCLFAAARPDPVAPAAAERLAPDTVPPLFSQVLTYASWLLGVAAPPVLRDPNGGASVRVLPAVKAAEGEPAAILLVGPQALLLPDKLALAFRLGRALSSMYPARAQALSMTPQQLKAWLQAASSLGSRNMDLDEEASRLRAQFVGMPNLSREVKPLIEKLSARGAPLNLSRWLRGLGHTADRLGLLACGDVPTAARVLADETMQTSDLLEFALGGELATVREALGLAIAD